VVAFGGGTGLPVLLRGLKDTVADLTAVVTVTDDGGSSGRLRQELGISPPGDIRNCLVALSERRGLAEVFDYRFDRAGAGDLADHAVGNIIIAALSDMGGGFVEGVEQAARFLRVKGKVYPAAVQSLTLVVSYEDGGTARGETQAVAGGKRISRVAVEPEDTPAPVPVLDAVRAADVVVLSPGSLFTSTIPALLGSGVREGLAGFEGAVVYVANVMTQKGETDGFSVAEHLRAIADHAGPVVTDVLVHGEELPEDTLSRYRSEGAAPVEVDRAGVERLGVRLHEADLAAPDDGSGVRHDPVRVAAEVRRIGMNGLLRR
jgi:uncharacterized cofD-like protein